MAGEEQKQTASQEKPKEEGKLKIEKIPGAFSKALDEVKKSGDKGWFEKISIFAKTFWNEIHSIEGEKKEASEAAKADAAKSIDAKMADARAAAKLDEKTPAADKEFFDEALAMGVTAGNELPIEMRDAFISGRGKLEKAVKGESVEDSTLDEVKALGSTTLLTISKLKAKYNDPVKFKEALDKLDKISDSSAYPLKKLLSTPVLKIFKVKIDMAGEGIQAVGDALGISEKGDGMKLLDSFKLSMGDALKLKGLKSQPIENEAEIAAIIKKSIFPNTEESKIKNVMKIANKLIVEKPDHVDNQTFTDLVFNIDDRDMKFLIEILTGKKAA